MFKHFGPRFYCGMGQYGWSTDSFCLVCAFSYQLLANECYTVTPFFDWNIYIYERQKFLCVLCFSSLTVEANDSLCDFFWSSWTWPWLPKVMIITHVVVGQILILTLLYRNIITHLSSLLLVQQVTIFLLASALLCQAYL